MQLAMALLLPAVALTSSWLLLGLAHDAKRTAVLANQEPEYDAARQVPFRAPIGFIGDYGLFADTRGMFRSVREDYDIVGAKIFWVDYGNGQEVLQYLDPRILQ